MIRIAIVEDQANDQTQLIRSIHQFSHETGYSIHFDVFEDGFDIADKYQCKWDIIFLDIRLKLMDGMEAAHRIRKLDSRVVIIFLTSMSKLAIRGYEVSALDFLVKPLEYSNFARCMQRAVNAAMTHSVQKNLMLPTQSGQVRVSTDQIFYIEVKNHNAYFMLEKGFYRKRATLHELSVELQGANFVRASNSYLVNLRNVHEVIGDILLVGTYKIPMSRNRKKEVLQTLSRYLSGDIS